jgi:imidazolonepropionase-like amidohydrolase
MDRRWPRSAAGIFSLATLMMGQGTPPIPAPGFRPEPPRSHALVGARVFTKPGSEFARATILIRDGRIRAIAPDLSPPPDARVWDLSGLTVYPGFIDPYVVVGSTNPPVLTAATEPVQSSLTGGSDPRFFGVEGQEVDPGKPGPGSTVTDVTPEFRVALTTTPQGKLWESLRESGFTAANVVPARGLLRGQSALISLSDASPNTTLLRADTAQHVAFSPAGGDTYPASLMGVVAVLRQTWLDAGWYAADHAHFAGHPTDRNRPEFNNALAALAPTLNPGSRQPVVFEPGSILMLDRAVQIAKELGLSAQLVASGQEWRRPDLLSGLKFPIITPVVQSAAPKFPEESAWEGVSLDQLRQWDWAPENPAVIRRAGAELALTTHALPERKEFRTRLRAALDRGLTEVDALAGLTTVPAKLCGLENQLGTIEPGKLAFLTIVEGSYFQPEDPLRAVWIDGRPTEFPPKPKSTPEKTNAPAKSEMREIARRRVAREPLSLRGPQTNPPALLIRHATIWTCGPQGILTNASLWVREGLVVSVGSEPAVVPEGTYIIDAGGRHISPGLIDAHSHSMVLGAVNEGTLPDTAMCRIGDVVNSETDNLHQQLAGGLTVANLLHGSANPIGGQNCVIKLRDGASPEGLKFTNAPAGIKFALGENVKQSNWGDKRTTRFPQTRMGVGTFYVNRFTAARQYNASRAAWLQSGRTSPPHRRDLSLEALTEILSGTRLIHCHSYRQDEVLAFLRTMESFGIKVATLQHILEGYKIADEIARHGAGASAFSDWWAYKYEVIDAIPYAGSLLHERGVSVSFNSDSSDLARRLNVEAAKAVKYGGTPEIQALGFVTLNPARQLKIDRWVGSLEPGKDADLVIWSGPPLDSSSVCEQTWIEGRLYFDRAQEPSRVEALRSERADLIAKAKKMTAGSPGSDHAASEGSRALFFERAWEQARSLGVIQCQDCRLHQRD